MKFWQWLVLITVAGVCYIAASFLSAPRYQISSANGLIIRLDRLTGDMSDCYFEEAGEALVCWNGIEYRRTREEFVKRIDAAIAADKTGNQSVAE